MGYFMTYERCLPRGRVSVLALAVVLWSGGAEIALGGGTTVPPAADGARVQPTPPASPNNFTLPSERPYEAPAAQAPEQSKHVTLILKGVRVTGMTVFTNKDIADIYAASLNHEVTLDTLWTVAAKLTERYHNAGYFLSRAIVVPQQIDNGVVTLQVIEGYIGAVKFDGPMADNAVVKQWLDVLQSYRPLKADQVESVLLHLNDIAGVSVRAVLQPMQNLAPNDGGVQLLLEPQSVPKVAGTVSADNFGSRYLGPYESQLQAQVIEAPGQRTTISLLSAYPLERLQYGSLKHEAAVWPSATVEVYGSYTHAHPEYTLTAEHIYSVSSTYGLAVGYSFIRQRLENLSARVAFDVNNSHSNIFNTALTRDRLRVFRAGLNYENVDGWNGQNTLDATLSQGVNVFNASQPGDSNLSHAGAVPTFTKIAVNAARVQEVTPVWSVMAALSGQRASTVLYSPEQFGYGGQAFGRAYDNSTITGDDGASASLEVRYGGIPAWQKAQLTPYAFYDAGEVWSREPLGTTAAHATGTSAGLGARISSEFGFSGNLGIALPLTRVVVDPIYGNGKSPRYFLQASYAF